jgi:hypothetical protein
MPLLPGVFSATLTDTVIRKRPYPFLGSVAAQMNSTVTDSGSSPTTRLRKGNVIVYDTPSGTWFLANQVNDGAHGDRCQPASVSSTGTGDGTWNSAVVTVSANGGPNITVTLGAATATAAAAVTDLNNNAEFKAIFIADVNSTFVRIRSKHAGADQYIAASCTANSFFGAGVTMTAVGTDAFYAVIETIYGVDMIDPMSGSATAAIADASCVGWYDTTALLNSTPESLAVLRRNGSLLFAAP